MINIAFPEDPKRRLPFYLAAEEWAARMLPPDEYFMAWRVNPTVICGRNQIIANEVDLDFCQNHGIDVMRRKSGGGCVYADMNNYMFSYISPSSEVVPTFGRYSAMIVYVLQTLGIDAHANGRNDIFVGDCKIAGNAFYRLPNRAIAHGTLLVDYDAETISKAITPSKIKREAKGVASVAAHVTSLRKLGNDISTEEFGRLAVRIICRDRRIVPTPEQIAQIEEIEKSYYKPSFMADKPRTRRRRHARETVVHRRIENVGEFFMEIALDVNSKIADIDLQGDFFALDDFRTLLLQPLIGLSYDAATLNEAASSLPAEKAIANMTRRDFANLLIENTI